MQFKITSSLCLLSLGLASAYQKDMQHELGKLLNKLLAQLPSEYADMARGLERCAASENSLQCAIGTFKNASGVPLSLHKELENLVRAAEQVQGDIKSCELVSDQESCKKSVVNSVVEKGIKQALKACEMFEADVGLGAKEMEMVKELKNSILTLQEKYLSEVKAGEVGDIDAHFTEELEQIQKRFQTITV